MLALSAFLEPFRAVNLIHEAAVYRWSLLSAAPGPVAASNGFAFAPDASVEDAKRYDRVAVVTGGDADRIDPPGLIAWLRAQARQGGEIGGLADAAVLLARAGLLEGRSVSVHWDSAPALRERFPRVRVRQELWTIDGQRFTSAGGISAFDLALDLVERDHGKQLADAVSDWFVHDRVRPGADHAGLSIRARTGIADATVLRAISAMELNLSEPLHALELAERVGVSRDDLERRFRRATGEAPMAYYRSLRLLRARVLVRRTDQRLSDIGAACGFAQASRFSELYRRTFGLSPSSDRAAARER